MVTIKKEDKDEKLIKEAMRDVKKEDYQQFQRDEILTPEEAQSKIALLLAETKEPKLMSELGAEEVKLVSALKTVADEVEAEMLKMFIDNFLQMRVSLKRQGRREILEVSRATTGTEERMRKGLRSVILGLK